MEEKSLDQRFCSFLSAHPHPMRKAKGCQFEGAPLYWAGESTFCIFHLPLDAAITPHALAPEGFGFAGTKRKWSAEENDDFAKYLKTLTANSRNSVRDLTGVVFPSDSYFRETNLSNALLGECTFHKRSGVFSFIGTQFAGEHTSFQHAHFLSPAQFTDARFSAGGLWFIGCHFAAGANFSGCQFPPKGAFFPDVTFDGAAKFQHASFQRAAQFTNSVFADSADFTGCDFPGGAQFRGVHFRGPASFADGGETAADPRQPINGTPGTSSYDFTGARFKAAASFAGRLFGAPAVFADTQFHEAPAFHGAELREGSVFPPLANFPSRGAPEDEARYGALKHKAAAIHATADKEKFWILEMMSRRRSGANSGGRAERSVQALYETFGLYGSSMGRPLLWFAILVLLVFPLLYGGYFALWRAHPAMQSALEAFRFSFAQTFRPFSVWSDAGVFPASAAGMEPAALLLAFVGTVQSLLVLALAVLLVIALRRRFRLA